MGRIEPGRQLIEKHRFIEPHRQDPYRTQTKPKGTPQCSECHAYSIQGRWVQKDRALENFLDHIISHKNSQTTTICPACRELQDHYAGSVVELHGEAWKEKSDQIFQTIGRSEEIARARNDQERILWTEDRHGIMKIFVTLPELARQIGHVLKQTFKGHAEYRRSTEEPFLRVLWTMEPSPLKKTRRMLRKSKHLRNRGVSKA
jgi:hypothetical protein